MKPPISQSAERRARIVCSAVVLLCAVAVEWYFTRVSKYPAWFLVLLPSLVGLNLLNWISEAGRAPEQVTCKGCGWKRKAPGGRSCPKCGAEREIPLLNRCAIGLVLVFFGAWIALPVWIATEATRAADRKAMVEAYSMVVGAVLVTIGLVAEICGFRLMRRLNVVLGRSFPYRFDRDSVRLKWRRDCAIRAILFVTSMTIFVSAVAFMIKNAHRTT